MINILRNPFEYGRIEHEEHGINPILYLSPSIFEYASKQPIIFMGVRGSGKSSILKSLTWEVAWKISKMKICGKSEVKDMFNRMIDDLRVYRVAKQKIDNESISGEIERQYGEIKKGVMK